MCDLLHKYSGLTQIEIGKSVGDIDYTDVNKLRVRLRDKMLIDRQVSASYKKVDAKLKELSSLKI